MHIEIFIFQFKQDIVMKMKLSTNDYEANALAIMDLPFVKKLVEENKKLKRKNKALKSLIYSLPEFRRPEHKNRACVDESDSDSVVIVNKVKKEHIVYEIEEDPPIRSRQVEPVNLTRCSTSVNSFTEVEQPGREHMNTKCIYTDEGETIFSKTAMNKQETVASEDEYGQHEEEQEEKEEPVKLCVNMDCERYPPDWDFEKDTEETYQEGQWQKCNLCDGYFNDDGMGDILYVQEEPNNQEAECNLCGKTTDIVQMKGTGQYLCSNACDEEEVE